MKKIMILAACLVGLAIFALFQYGGTLAEEDMEKFEQDLKRLDACFKIPECLRCQSEIPSYVPKTFDEEIFLNKKRSAAISSCVDRYVPMEELNLTTK